MSEIIKDNELFSKMETGTSEVKLSATSGRAIGMGLSVIAFGLVLGCRYIARAINRAGKCTSNIEEPQ